MGTFHDTTDPLHGITVIAFAGDTVHVGRCHERDEQQIVLLDADEHTEGQDDRTVADYLDRASRFGVWKKHERLVLAVADVERLTPLSEYFRNGDKAPSTVVAQESPVEPAPTVESSAVADPTAPVNLTDSARGEVRRLLAQEENRGQGLRLGINGGGCSGLVYNVEFDRRKDGDIVVAEDGFDIYLDRKSTIYLRGVTLDYQQGLSGRGFQFQNPNASNTCGCGESFAV